MRAHGSCPKFNSTSPDDHRIALSGPRSGLGEVIRPEKVHIGRRLAQADCPGVRGILTMARESPIQSSIYEHATTARS